MNKAVYNSIIEFVDRNLCNTEFDYDRYKHLGWHNVFFWKYQNKPTKGKFVPNGKIHVYRENNIPEESIDEIITILHEYGHFTSLKNGIGKIAETGYDYNIEWQDQRLITFKEECKAWYYALNTIHLLPITPFWKIIVLIETVKKLIIALAGYAFGLTTSPM